MESLTVNRVFEILQRRKALPVPAKGGSRYGRKEKVEAVFPERVCEKIAARSSSYYSWFLNMDKQGVPIRDYIRSLFEEDSCEIVREMEEKCEKLLGEPDGGTGNGAWISMDVWRELLDLLGSEVPLFVRGSDGAERFERIAQAAPQRALACLFLVAGMDGLTQEQYARLLSCWRLMNRSLLSEETMEPLRRARAGSLLYLDGNRNDALQQLTQAAEKLREKLRENVTADVPGDASADVPGDASADSKDQVRSARRSGGKKPVALQTERPADAPANVPGDASADSKDQVRSARRSGGKKPVALQKEKPAAAPADSRLTNDALMSGGMTNDALTSGGMTNDALASGGMANDALASGGMANDALTSNGMTNDLLTESPEVRENRELLGRILLQMGEMYLHGGAEGSDEALAQACLQESVSCGCVDAYAPLAIQALKNNQVQEAGEALLRGAEAGVQTCLRILGNSFYRGDALAGGKRDLQRAAAYYYPGACPEDTRSGDSVCQYMLGRILEEAPAGFFAENEPAPENSGGTGSGSVFRAAPEYRDKAAPNSLFNTTPEYWYEAAARGGSTDAADRLNRLRWHAFGKEDLSAPVHEMPAGTADPQAGKAVFQKETGNPQAGKTFLQKETVNPRAETAVFQKGTEYPRAETAVFQLETEYPQAETTVFQKGTGYPQAGKADRPKETARTQTGTFPEKNSVPLPGTSFCLLNSLSEKNRIFADSMPEKDCRILLCTNRRETFTDGSYQPDDLPGSGIEFFHGTMAQALYNIGMQYLNGCAGSASRFDPCFDFRTDPSDNSGHREVSAKSGQQKLPAKCETRQQEAPAEYRSGQQEASAECETRQREAPAEYRSGQQEASAECETRQREAPAEYGSGQREAPAESGKSQKSAAQQLWDTFPRILCAALDESEEKNIQDGLQILRTAFILHEKTARFAKDRPKSDRESVSDNLLNENENGRGSVPDNLPNEIENGRGNISHNLPNENENGRGSVSDNLLNEIENSKGSVSDNLLTGNDEVFYLLSDRVKVCVLAGAESAAPVFDSVCSRLGEFYLPLFLCDPAKMASAWLLDRLPVFLPCLETPGWQKEDVLPMNVTIFGDHPGIVQLCKDMIAAAQIDDTQRFPFSLTVVGENADRLEEKFLSDCPGLADLPENAFSAKPVFCRMRPESRPFQKLLSTKWKTERTLEEEQLAHRLQTSSYLVVYTTDESRNLTLSMYLREWFLKTDPGFTRLPFIAAYCEKRERAEQMRTLTAGAETAGFSWFNNYRIEAFGMTDQLFTCEALVHGRLEQRAMASHFSYCTFTDTEDRFRAEHDYFSRYSNRDSSLMNALALPYRLFSAGIAFRDWHDYAAGISQTSLARQFDDWLNARDIREDDTRPLTAPRPEKTIPARGRQHTENGNRAEKPVAEKITAERHRRLETLSMYEHGRWNRSMLSRGWLPATTEQMLTYIHRGNTRHQLYIAKLHPFLCTWEQLGEAAPSPTGLQREYNSIMRQVRPDKEPADIHGIDRQNVRNTAKILLSAP